MSEKWRTDADSDNHAVMMIMMCIMIFGDQRLENDYGDEVYIPKAINNNPFQVMLCLTLPFLNTSQTTATTTATT